MSQNGWSRLPWTGDVTELGGLSADERDQLATDLRREQDLAHEREHVTDGSPCWCGPTTIGPDGSSGKSGTDSVSTSTSASTPGPGMTIVNATGRRVEFRVTAIPDAYDFDTANGINVTTGLSLHTPIVEPALSTKGVRFGDRLRECVAAEKAEDPHGIAGNWYDKMESVAAAIDQDAEDLYNSLGQRL